MIITEGGHFITCPDCGERWKDDFFGLVPHDSPNRNNFEREVKRKKLQFRCCRVCGWVYDRLK